MVFEGEIRADAGQPHPFLNVWLSAYSWCLHCQKVHKTSAWQEKDWECPGCGGSAMDVWRWEQVCAVQPLFPRVPQEGCFYPIYGHVTAAGDGCAAAEKRRDEGRLRKVKKPCPSRCARAAASRSGWRLWCAMRAEEGIRRVLLLRPYKKGSGLWFGLCWRCRSWPCC